MRRVWRFLKIILCLTACHGAHRAQAITIGEAIEQEDRDWFVETLPIDPLNSLELKPENLWFPILNDSYDGVDALTVVAPTQPTYSRLKTTVPGPVRIRFRSKVNFQSGPNHLQFYAADIAETQLTHFFLPPSEDWTFTNIVLLKEGPHTLVWQIMNLDSPNAQAWLDDVEIRPILSSNLVEAKDPFPAPLGKPVKLSVPWDGFDQLNFQWYRDSKELPGETEPTILIPAGDQPSQATYQIKISDNLGSMTSIPITVEHIDLSSVLDNNSLSFSVPDSETFDYSNLIVRGEDAWDGDKALFLKVDRDENDGLITTPTLLSTEIEGPVILNYYNSTPLKVEVDGVFPDGITHIPTEIGGWYRTYVPIYGSGIHTVNWSNNWGIQVGGKLFYYAGIMDRLSLSHDPIFDLGPFDQTVPLGEATPPLFSFISVGKFITQQLLKEGQVVEEAVNGSIGFETLGLGDDGTYQIRISNELGGEVTSEPFEIRVAATVEAALNQTHLDWDYRGKPWEPQQMDTQDGGLAAWIPEDNSVQGNGILSTSIKGPALVSFWWKRGPNNKLSFQTDDRSVILSPPGDSQWHFIEVLVDKSMNDISWNGEAGAMLDNVVINYLETDFFKEWAYQHFNPDEVSNAFDSIRDGDSDRDGLSNLLEWVLNRDLFKAEPLPELKEWIENDLLYQSFQFTRPAIIAPYKIVLESSDDMQTWRRFENPDYETFNKQESYYSVQLRDALPLGTAARFIRLKVTSE